VRPGGRPDARARRKKRRLRNVLRTCVLRISPCQRRLQVPVTPAWAVKPTKMEPLGPKNCRYIQDDGGAYVARDARPLAHRRAPLRAKGRARGESADDPKSIGIYVGCTGDPLVGHTGHPAEPSITAIRVKRPTGLYGAWRKGSPAIRKRILDDPELFFKTQRKSLQTHGKARGAAIKIRARDGLGRETRQERSSRAARRPRAD
jgi:hypothetical protein